MKIRLVLAALVVAGSVPVSDAVAAAPSSPERPRVVLLTDYWKDPDEVQAMIRFLCYANEFEIEGLVATSLAYGDGAVRPEWIVDILGDYGKVQPSLQANAPPGRPFPTAGTLQRIVRAGAPMIRRLVGPGKGFVTPFPAGARDSRECEPAENWLRADRISAGAKHLIEVVDRPDPRPVWVLVWGGAIDLAQAIWKVRQERTPDAAARFIDKLRVHQSSWQDTGTVWLWNNVPDLFFILTLLSRGGLNAESPEELRNEAWIRRHLLTGHGPLAARYPVVTEKGRKLAIKEGDAPTFLYLLAPGLSDPGEPEWGGWGGRRERVPNGKNFFVDARDRHPTSQDPLRESYWPIARFADAISRDFAARLDWCVRVPAAANHAPLARIDGDATTRVLRRTVHSGQTLTLDAAASIDPDGGALDFAWSHYAEPGTFRGSVALRDEASPRATIVAPAVSQAETAHLILAVTDRGEPRLTSYRRVIVTFEPAGSR